MKFHSNRWSRSSIRLRGYDYTKAGVYFVTLCTFESECLFGEVVDGEMLLSEAGEIARRCWMRIPEHFANVDLDEFQIMPNHVHGIVVLKSFVGTRHAVSLQQQNTQQFGKPVPGSLSTIIRSYKSAVSKCVHTEGHAEFAWQSRFHDRIIRNHKEFQNIRKYICENPAKWESDEENPVNIAKRG